jgi:hypothetical protein
MALSASIRHMSIRHLLLWLPLVALAQTPTAALEADQALRARVSEFLQDHVDGNFRKAYEMVADDTKDQYFSVGKVKLLGFKVGDIKFADDFTKATVMMTVSKMFNVQGQDIPVQVPSTTTWKIENGKWVWYDDTKHGTLTSLLPGVPDPPPAATVKGGDVGDGGLPKDFNDKALAAAAQSILQEVSVDKKEVTLAADKSSEEQVVFHNGMTGSVQLELSAPEIPGFSVKLAQSLVRAAGDVPMVLRYEPGDQAERRGPVNIRLTVQPLNQVFVIRVNFAAAGPVVPK